MILVTLNKSRQLLAARYIGRVRMEDFQRSREDLQAQLKELSPGFSLLGDFTQLETMDPECAAELGQVMELLAKSGVGLVVRVMPDASKDIGLNILSAFHYPREARISTCKSLAEAAKVLKL